MKVEMWSKCDEINLNIYQTDIPVTTGSEFFLIRSSNHDYWMQFSVCSVAT